MRVAAGLTPRAAHGAVCNYRDWMSLCDGTIFCIAAPQRKALGAMLSNRRASTVVARCVLRPLAFRPSFSVSLCLLRRCCIRASARPPLVCVAPASVSFLPLVPPHLRPGPHRAPSGADAHAGRTAKARRARTTLLSDRARSGEQHTDRHRRHSSKRTAHTRDLERRRSVACVRTVAPAHLWPDGSHRLNAGSSRSGLCHDVDRPSTHNGTTEQKRTAETRGQE